MTIEQLQLTISKKMKFILNIQCDNAAFEDDPGEEVTRILQSLITKLESGRRDSIVLHDLNGNRVGMAEFIEKE